MSLEGPPELPPQQQEREPVTRERVVEAMGANPPDLETIRAWYDQEAQKADKGKTGEDRMNLTFNVGVAQMEAGQMDLGMDSLGASLMDANGLGLLKAAGIIMDTIRQLE